MLSWVWHYTASDDEAAHLDICKILPFGQVCWGCRIHRPNLCRGLKSTPTSVLDMTRNNLMVSNARDFGNAEYLCHRNTSLLPSLPGSLWPWVLAPDRVLSMLETEINSVFTLNWIVWNRTVLTFKLSTYAKLNCLRWNCFSYWNGSNAKLNCLK